VLHAFEGTLDPRRPLRELATVFDMTGLGFDVVRDALRSNETGLSFDATIASGRGYAVTGSIDDARFDPEDVLWRLAAAMEADGIRFKLELLDADGVARVTYESDH
jgi:hypothetical protein